MGMTILLLVVGLVLLVTGAEGLVRGSVRLARLAGLSRLVVGLTVVAVGTSAPEAAVSLQAALAGAPDVAVGNVTGSNTFNVLVILALSALVAPLAVRRQLVRLDLPVMVAVSLLVWALAGNGLLGAWESVMMLVLLAGYTVVLVILGRRGGEEAESGGVAEPSDPLPLSFLFTLGGLALLVFGARLFVAGARDLALAAGISEAVVAATVVAAGTSLPEVAASIVAVVRGQRDLAVGNVVGSNIFNLLGVLGLSGIAAPQGLAVSQGWILRDFPIMVATALIVLPMAISGARVDRREGLVLLLLYAGYVLLLLHPSSLAAGAFAGVLVGLVLLGWAAALAGRSRRLD